MIRIASTALAVCLPFLALPALGQNNTLTPVESATGWKLLWDGKTNAGLVQGNPPLSETKGPTLHIDDSAITTHITATTSMGDFCTKDLYDNFELSADYKYGTDGNSGIIWRTRPDEINIWKSGVETAIQDNGRANNLYKNGDGALYDVISPSKDMWRGPDRWNRMVIWIVGSKVEHWQNGEKVIDIDMTSKAWKDSVAKSKWVDPAWDTPNWAKETSGRVCFQDHGAEYKTWFRNLKIRVTQPTAPLPAPVLTPKGGAFAGTQQVSMEAAVVGSSIRYTLDGSAPTASSPLYSGPVSVPSTRVIKAITLRPGMTSSAAATESYQIGSTGISPYAPSGFRWSLQQGAEPLLRLHFPVPSTARLTVLDPRGRIRLARTETESEVVLPLRGLSPGVYWFQAASTGYCFRQAVFLF